METCNSDAKVDVVNAQNLRRRLGPIESGNSDAKVAISNAQYHR